MDNISIAIKAIYDLLKADMDMDIFLGSVSGEPKLPYVIIGSSDLTSNDTKTSSGYILEIQAHIVAGDMANVLTHSAKIRELLHNQTFDDVSCIHFCQHQSTMNFNETKPLVGGEVILPQSIIKFNLIIE